MKTWKVCLLIACGVLLSLYAWDATARQNLLSHYVSGEQNAGRIAQAYAPDLARCDYSSADSLHVLMRALLTVETFVTPPWEAQVRSVLVNATHFAGRVNDMSVGVGRIRTSSALAAIAVDDSDARSTYRTLSRDEVARRLQSTCDAFHIGLLILRMQAEGTPLAIDRRFIWNAARRYGGKAWGSTSVESELSARIYFDLVYELFLHYRFIDLAN